MSFGEGSREWQLLRRLAIVVISQFDFYSIQSRYYKPLSSCFSSNIKREGGTVKKGISFRRLEGTRNGEKIMELVVV